MNAWKPPAAMPGACSTGEIDALVKFLDESTSSFTYAAMKASVTNAACKACLFGPDDASWRVFVEAPNGDLRRINFGGCLAIVSGKESCGKAFSQYDDCIFAACADCGDQKSFDNCRTPARNFACSAAATTLTTECPTDTLSACDDLARKYPFEAPARSLCVGLDGG